jgi:hypothetical protein
MLTTDRLFMPRFFVMWGFIAACSSCAASSTRSAGRASAQSAGGMTMKVIVEPSPSGGKMAFCPHVRTP